MDVFQEKAQSYDQWFVENEALFQSEKEAVKKMMPAREDLAAPAIEIGVGTGLFASALGIEEGLEPSEDMGRVARQRGIRVIQSPAETMPMASESYGMALMVTVDCFLADVEQAFSEVNRILVPGGWFVIAFLDRETPLGQIYQANKDSDDRSVSECDRWVVPPVSGDSLRRGPRQRPGTVCAVLCRSEALHGAGEDPARSDRFSGEARIREGLRIHACPSLLSVWN